MMDRIKAVFLSKGSEMFKTNAKHPDKKLAFKKRNLIFRQWNLLPRVNKSICTSVKEILLDEFADKYSENGIKDWLKNITRCCVGQEII